MADYETLLVEQRGPALVVTVNRPESLNALSETVIGELSSLIAEFRKKPDPTVRGVIITGAGDRAFVAGADIRGMSGMTASELEKYGEAGQGLTLSIEQLPVPVIAVVNGFALGGGCELALACDFIYASANAAFGLPEVTLGLIPGFGGTVRLPHRVGLGLARELTYTARRLSAAEALQAGLVNRVFDTAADAMTAAEEAVAAIAANSRVAVREAKASITDAYSEPTFRGLDGERARFVTAFEGADAREGTSAFLEKRKPEFPSARG